MLKDTFGDYHKYFLNERVKTNTVKEEAEAKAEEKAKAMGNEFIEELKTLIQKISKERSKIETFIPEIEEHVYTTINKSRKVDEEALEETIEERILKILKGHQQRGLNKIGVDILIRIIREDLPEIPPYLVINRLSKLKDKGILSWEGIGLDRDDTIVIKKRIP